MNSVNRKETRRKSKRVKKFFSGILVLLIAVGCVNLPMDVYAADEIEITCNDTFQEPGQSVSIEIKIKNNNTKKEFEFDKATLEVTGGGVSVEELDTKVTIPSGEVHKLSFDADIDQSASAGERDMILVLYQNDGKRKILEETLSGFSVAEKYAAPRASYDGNYTISFDVKCTTNHSEGLLAGSDNILTVQLFNRGNTHLKNTDVSLTLPEGITPHNASTSVNAGYVTIGSSYTAKFPLTVDSKMESKNYPIEVNILGADRENSSQNLKKVFYFPVIAGNSTYSTDNVDITNVSMPNQVLGGEDFTLSFAVKNQGSTDASDLKVSVEMPEGIVNKTKNVFSLKKLEKNETKNYNVTMVCPDKTTEKYYSFKITVEPMGENKGSSISQFAGTLVKGVSGSSKTPQLMVESYNYGGSYVQAGDEFILNLGIYNTNKSHDLQNIKVTVSSEDGTFIPVQSSNSFYIDGIKAKERMSHALHMTTKQDAEQKTSTLTVEMSYEDSAGNALEAKDVISIPIMQEARLVIDDIIAPSELYAGMQTGGSVKFYNMGKTVLNNLRVDISGDFDTMESNLYYVGNMEGGKSDSFDYSFTPRQQGPMSGVITFIYENASGEEMRFEKPFEFQVMEEMPFDDMEMMPEEEVKKKPWLAIGIAAAAVIVIGGVIFWRRRRRKKLHQEMEIDE
ncbi:COG1361 S-layer family protein [Sinanaerobacter sp. ZZT-01]|uniref:COG1361 S-layer family protein n=1 Tax=Sinanaerobacter sp. ZZT-01 TaxID=3111540 RepID=UPI002D76DF8C|nr:CARDB domain-containing protein [Sinanaerobacter sp. ZZT-01]WRR94915.1 CARDB domain-containing protein [Sinanaerobacter sp. ZZT-01]